MAAADQLDRIDAALRFVPADDFSIWTDVGMALHSELGDAGFGLFDQWSATSHKYNAREVRNKWRYFHHGAVGIGTLFHHAYAHGFHPNKPAPPRPIPVKPPPEPRANTGTYALKIWARADRSDDAVAAHPYALPKGINWSAGAGRAVVSGSVVGKDADCLIIPIRHLESDRVVAIQAINPSGQKQTFGPVSGNAFIIGNTLDKSLPWIITEGFADAVTMAFHTYKGNAAVFAACGKSMMAPLAECVVAVFAPDRLIVTEDAL